MYYVNDTYWGGNGYPIFCSFFAFPSSPFEGQLLAAVG
jgi:hypothetical protein